jgi:tripartite-type tricarboxylate transporter receptor subunit TctC
MTAEMLQHRAGVQLSFVPYPTSAKAAQDGMAGVVSLFVESLGTVGGGLERGSVRALAVGSSTRLPNFPDVPTISETLPGFEARGWFGLMALAGTPENIVTQINHDLRSVLEQKELRQRLQALGTYARAMSPGETADFIRKEQALWSPIVAQLGGSTQ